MPRLRDSNGLVGGLPLPGVCSAWNALLEGLPQSERCDPLAAWHSRLISANTNIRDQAASAWLSYDMAVGKVPSSQLQSWSGEAWSQSAIGSGAIHALPRLRRQQVRGDMTAVPPSFASNGSSGSEPSSPATPSQGASTTRPPADASSATQSNMSSFVAQAMLTAHYSINSAFLLDKPILENIDRLRNIPAIAIQGRLDLVCPPGTAFEVHKAWPELRLRLVGGAGHSQYDPAVQHEVLEATDAMRDLSWCRNGRMAVAQRLGAQR